MKVVSIINYKGGVGKTTLTANLGAYAAMKGYRVLLIDLDPQTHLTFSFVTEEEWQKKYMNAKTLKNYFDSVLEPEKCGVVPLPSLVIRLMLRDCARIDLVASNLELANLDTNLVGSCGTGDMARVAGSQLPKNSQKAPSFSYGDEWLNIVY